MGGMLFLLILIFAVTAFIVELSGSECPKCFKSGAMVFTSLGMFDDRFKRWVCFSPGCDYEQKIRRFNSNPEWQAWRKGQDYYEKPSSVGNNGNNPIKWERVYFDTTPFVKFRDEVLAKQNKKD